VVPRSGLRGCEETFRVEAALARAVPTLAINPTARRSGAAGAAGAEDADAPNREVPPGGTVELSLVDLRWQMVLDCLGAANPPFSQGALQTFRERMIAHEMDRAPLDRTVDLVRRERYRKEMEGGMPKVPRG
jgi:hypothetical protein